ncbi:pyridoxamine 5'-phosphate oxidase family protein [Paenibacillus sp. JSM ZJ436]|uniref:pyridoxamine 5'-phosphate oxidase family protein n=1 Tax=Paenibacillus sp. JSM ZJ436 TaxID=3376190 RepID=UPI0037A1302E
MSHSIKLPEQLCRLLDGENLEEKQGEGIQLLTQCEDGWPHCAMIGAGEIIALQEDVLRLALWPGTMTTGNVIRTGKATIVLVHGAKMYYIRLVLVHLATLASARHPRERFEARIEAIREDQAPYADIVCGVTYRLKQPEEVLARWRETLEELRQ